MKRGKKYGLLVTPTRLIVSPTFSQCLLHFPLARSKMQPVFLLEGQVEARWFPTAEPDPVRRGETLVLPSGLMIDVRLRLLPKLANPWLSLRPVSNSDGGALTGTFLTHIIPAVARNLAVRLDWRLRLGLDGRMPPAPYLGAASGDDGTPAYRLFVLGLDRLARHARYMTAIGKAADVLDTANLLADGEGAAEYEPSPMLTRSEWREWFGVDRVPEYATKYADESAWLSLAQVLNDVDDAPLRLQLMQNEPRFRPQLRALYYWSADELDGVAAALDGLRSTPTPTGETNVPYNPQSSNARELAVFLGDTATDLSPVQRLAACIVAALIGYLVDGPASRALIAQLGHDAMAEAWQTASAWVDKRAGPERL